jgi:hypothetical protein
MEQEKIIADDAGLESKFIKLPKDKRIYLSITNWNTYKTIKNWNGEPEEKPEWRAEVLKYGDSPLIMNVCLEPKLLAQTSKAFRFAINQKLVDKDRKQTYLISIKKTGEKKDLSFDIELLQ